MGERPPAVDPCASELSIDVASAARMRSLGRRLGRAMLAGDVLALVGPLGSGKTTLAQGLAHGLGVRTDRHVSSPSFALVNQHPGRVRFVHVDFYRIKDAGELPELGLDESFDDAATAVEWSDRFPDALPADRLEITISTVAGGGRSLRVRPTGPRGRRLAHALAG